MTPRGASACLLVLLLALTSACGKAVAGEPQAASGSVVGTTPSPSTKTSRPSTSSRPTTSTPRTSGKPSTSDVLGGLAGTWEGEYTCGQGNTGLRLTIKWESKVALTTFEFFPLASNPTAERGSYLMVGTISPAGQLVFKQSSWLDQPPGYVMVDLAVTSPFDADSKQLSGDVLMDNCKGFSVRKR